jgi:hypothetical protein
MVMNQRVSEINFIFKKQKRNEFSLTVVLPQPLLTELVDFFMLDLAVKDSAC